MRRLSLAAFLAVPLLLLVPTTPANANPTESRGFGCAGFCLKLFPNIHQHGPLFNYGPYYGYYPFKPYGPWDAYLRYDPYFYGDPYRNWGANQEQQEAGNMYGRNSHLGNHGHRLHGQHLNLFHKGGNGCSSCGFWHASWLHGGWFRGHQWLQGGFGHQKTGCKSCGGVALAPSTEPTGDAVARYSGFGNATQSAVFYTATPTLDPVLELVPTAAQTK